MVVNVSALDKNVFVGWRKLVDSRLRQLGLLLEGKVKAIHTAHLYPQVFQYKSMLPYRSCWFIGIGKDNHDFQLSETDLTAIRNDFLAKVYRADLRYCQKIPQTDLYLEVIDHAHLKSMMKKLCRQKTFDDFGTHFDN